MDIRQLQHFVAVYELRSVSAASARLHIAQPAVSRTLQALVADIGVELFARQGRGIRPTPAADRLYLYACQLIKDVETARLQVQSTQDTPVGHITFACTSALGRIVAPAAIQQFHEMFPLVTFSIWEGSGETINEWLLTGVVDVAMLTSPVPSPTIRAWGRHTEQMYVAMSPNVTAADLGVPVKDNYDIADLSNLPLILPRRGNSHRTLIEQSLARSRQKTNVKFEVDGVSTIKAMVAHNLGCTILIRAALANELSLGLLKCVPINPPGIQAEITVLSPRDRLQTRATQEFISLLTRSLAELAAHPDVADR